MIRFPTLLNPFQDGIFHFYYNFNRTFCTQKVASDLGWRCLPMSDKKDARPIWVKARIFLLVDLMGIFFSDLGSGDEKEINKKALKMTS